MDQESIDIVDATEDINRLDKKNKLINFITDNYLRLNDIPGLVVSNVTTTNVFFVTTSTECIQFNVDCNFQLDFKVQLIIVFPKVVEVENSNQPLKLRIHVEDDSIRKEMLSCTNYLQRQRNIILTLHILRKWAIALSERKLIYDMLLLHFHGVVNSRHHEDGGIVMVCEDRKSGFKFFETTWRIQFNCKERVVFDVQDFNICTYERRFYNSTKSVMCKLTEPALSYPTKVELWSSIIDSANMASSGSAIIKNWKDDDVIVEEITSSQIIKYELSDLDDDDDDDCILVDTE